MALKLGKIEIGYRLLISLVVIAIAYGFLGSQIYIYLRSGYYLNAGYCLSLAAIAFFAIPQSLGGLLAAIIAVAIIYIQNGLNDSLIATGVCLAMYLIGFQDIRYKAELDKKLSFREIVATFFTVGFMAQISWLILKFPSSWLSVGIIGAIAGALTLVGKQLIDTDLPQEKIWRLFCVVTFGSLVMGLAITAIFAPPPVRESLSLL